MRGLPKIAVVGRANVGKSTLYNRITGKRRAIVHSTPGVTRDTQRSVSEWKGVPFEVIDTGGLFSGREDPLAQKVEEKALREALSSDALIFVTDGTTGLTPGDSAIADVLRRSNSPVFLAVNKTEKAENRHAAGEFFKLGFNSVYEISALHGQGIGDLLDDVVSLLPKRKKTKSGEELRIAVVGRPNVGKSTLINALVGEEANIVNERPGTTRDSIDVMVRWYGRDITIVDTAGIKRRSRTKDDLSKLSVLKSLETISRADVILFMLDGCQPVSNQDVRIAGYAHQEGKGVIICVNKWDLVEKTGKSAKESERFIRSALAFLSYAPVLFLSALTGQRVSRIFPMAHRIKEARDRRIRTSELNEFIEMVVEGNPPPHHGGGNGKIYYATQTGVSPPTFTLFVNRSSFFDRSYLRFLNKRLRKKFSFYGTALRINLVEKKRRRS